MRTRLICSAALVVLVGLTLAGCHKGKQAQDLTAETATPQLAVQNAIKELKVGDFDGLLKHVLAPADYKRLRTEWTRKDHGALRGVSQAERQRFARNMQRLTQPGAKKKEFAKIAPMLDAWKLMRDKSLPMMIGMFSTAVGTEITQTNALTGEQKSQARGVLKAVTQWMGRTDWGSKAKAKKAVGIVVDTARALDIKTLKQASQLDYEQSMQRYATAWKGFKDLLAVYGLSVDRMLDSATAKTLKQNDDHAVVQVDFSILGKPFTTTVDMVRKGKRWYPRHVLEHWHSARAALAHAGSTAPASSVAAPATVPAPSASAAPATDAS
ncbi:MAG TPA: hypothetical protein VFJ15_04120 [Oleiagrimonas sp.]|nr:hypothetical protein [Oleiagrimonas sp.]